LTLRYSLLLSVWVDPSAEHICIHMHIHYIGNRAGYYWGICMSSLAARRERGGEKHLYDDSIKGALCA